MQTEARARRRAAIALSFLCALAACEPDEVLPTVPERDGAVEHQDGGLIVRRADGGQDGGPPVDAGDGGSFDGGRAPTDPRIDGNIEDAEWAGAIVETSLTASVAPFSFDRLERVLAIRTTTRLFVAIEGNLGTGNVMMMLLDADFGEGNGLVLSGGLSDLDGTLDRAISGPVWGSTLADFRPDYAWGTNTIPLMRTGADDVSGWREIASTVGEFQWLGAGTVSACTFRGCETSISLGTAGIPDAGEIALVVRIGGGFDVLSNQTLPMDDPSQPETISMVLRVPAP